MKNKTLSTPSPLRDGRITTAAGLLLLLATVCQPHPAAAQIEVDVLTSPTASARSSSATITANEDKSVPSATGLKQDKSADDAAQRIVPAPGTAMQSTEGSAFKTGEVRATEPSVKLNEDEAILKEGETTETVAVKSGVELLRMLGLQREAKPAVGGLEMDESSTNSLFDITAVKRLKGDEPTVVYRVLVDNTPLPDPMIVPWIRQAKLLQERFDKAVSLLAENKVDDGRQELLSIMSDFPDSDHATQAKAILAKLDDMNKKDAPAPVIKPKEETTVTVELSPNVHVGTVIVDPANPTGNRAMIGGKAYRVGDPIYGEAGHRVVSISDSVVQIEVQQYGLKKTFDIPVRPSGAND